MHKADFYRPFFPKQPWSLCEDKWPNFDAPLSSLKRFLGRRYFGFEFISSFRLFSQGLHNRCGKPSILRVQPNIYPTIENNAGFFFEKVFLKGTSPADHSLQQQKTVLQLAKSIFSFGCLRISLTVCVTLFNSLMVSGRYPENPAIWLVLGAGSIFLSPDHGHGNQLP